MTATPPPRRVTAEPPGWEGTRAMHDRLYGLPAEALDFGGIDPEDCGGPPARRLIHLVSGDGRSVVCGITRAQADAEYAPDAPPCPTCGPRGGRASATRARLTPHQRETFDRLEHLAQRSGDGWVSADTLGSRGALEHLKRKGWAERRTELGPRGGEHRSYRPVTP
jgi:hypothetical protein